MRRILIIGGLAVAHALVTLVAFHTAWSRNLSAGYPGIPRGLADQVAEILLFPFAVIIHHTDIGSGAVVGAIFLVSSLLWAAVLYGLGTLAYHCRIRHREATPNHLTNR